MTRFEELRALRKVRRVFGLDLHSWEQLMLWALAITGAGAVAIAVTTASVVSLQRAENARTKDEFERYKLDAGRRIAEANAQAEQAKLELEKFKAPRSLSHEQQSRITSKLKPFAGTVFDAAHGPKGDPEPIVFLRFLEPTLLSAGWIAIPWTGGGETYTEVGMPAIGLTAVTNVLVDVHPDWWAKYEAAATALAAALVAEGIDAKADSQPASVKSDAIHIRVGRKM